MPERLPYSSMLLCAGIAGILLVATPPVHAQKIVCWKDQSGKVVGCGDRIPTEFQKYESKTLDKRGITRDITVSEAEAARLREEKLKKAALKAEEDQRLAEQRRQDAALVQTYVSAQEIDVRRDRELQVVDLQIAQLQTALKNATEALAAQQKRHDNFARRNTPVPDAVRDDLARATEEKDRATARIADKEKEKIAIRERYAAQKARYIELKGASPDGMAPPSEKMKK